MATAHGVVLDVETARRGDSGRIIVESQRGDNPEVVSITNIRICRYSHADLQTRGCVNLAHGSVHDVRTAPERHLVVCDRCQVGLHVAEDRFRFRSRLSLGGGSRKDWLMHV